MKKLFVIAGNRQQYDNWCSMVIRAKRYGPETFFIYVSGVDTLRGTSDPDGICVGSWQNRSDIQDILQQLFVSCRSREKLVKLQSLRMLVNQTYLGAGRDSGTWRYDWTMQTK
jgi:hypothetical protein